MNLRDQISKGVGALRKQLADIGGANSRETRAAGRVLAKEMRRTLNVKASLIAGPLRPGAERKAAPSAPGEAPRRQKGRLVKSIGMEVVGGVLRVGSSSFVARILNDGTQHGTRGAKLNAAGKRRHKRQELKRAAVTIEPRPWADKSLEAALPKMEGEFVGELQKRGGV